MGDSESWATSAATRASMVGNRRSNTKPEVALRSALHAAGLRFRKDYPMKLDGLRFRPDVVFTRSKVAVFVDGCFWHSCPQHGTRPARNSDYWLPKLRRNIERDREQVAVLRAHGWLPLRIWEHEDLATATGQVRAAIRQQQGESSTAVLP